MALFIVRRLLQLVLVVLVASFVVFVALYVATNPVDSVLPLGAPQEAKDAMVAQLGLDRPWWVQYFDFLAHAVTGDFGQSTWLGTSAFGAVMERLPYTIMLAIPATLIGALIGVVAGAVAASRPGSWIDNLITVLTYGSISIAEFWLAIMLVLVFAVQFRMVPTTSDPTDPVSMIMPIIALGLRPMAHIAQMMRSSMIVEADRPYVMTARSKGLRERAVLTRHMMRNAAIPVVTLAIYDLSRIFAGTAVVVELVFAWPGIGRLAIDALERGDIFLVQSVVIVAAVITALLNLVADLLMFTLDPRTRAAIMPVRRRGSLLRRRGDTDAVTEWGGTAPTGAH
jgi:peptide/nickel transport system permease protein